LSGQGNDIVGVPGQKIRLRYVKYQSERIRFVSGGDGNVEEYAFELCRGCGGWICDAAVGSFLG